MVLRSSPINVAQSHESLIKYNPKSQLFTFIIAPLRKDFYRSSLVTFLLYLIFVSSNGSFKNITCFLSLYISLTSITNALRQCKDQFLVNLINSTSSMVSSIHGDH
ncbi:hypothetical protein HPP92_005568 [Vanilla planifolia]|uniref:Uncharacterized protein n=1 Tax=Vanilla planifolia TaxID=51239 RepID=A0A835VBH3_VANPL|nr:hypothetical protein HPP92_005568 [Vanilla planifolia]